MIFWLVMNSLEFFGNTSGVYFLFVILDQELFNIFAKGVFFSQMMNSDHNELST